MCGRRYGQRILDCEYSGQAEPVQAAGAEDTGKQGDPVPQGGQPGLIFFRDFGPGFFFCSWHDFTAKTAKMLQLHIDIHG